MAIHQYTYRFFNSGKHVLTKDFLAEDKLDAESKASSWFNANKKKKEIDSFKLIYPVKYIKKTTTNEGH